MRRRLLLDTDLVVVVRVGSLHNVVMILVMEGDVAIIVDVLSTRTMMLIEWVVSSVDRRGGCGGLRCRRRGHLLGLLGSPIIVALVVGPRRLIVAILAGELIQLLPLLLVRT